MPKTKTDRKRESLIDKVVTSKEKVFKYKVSKIMIWPSRTLNLGNYNSAQLNAGVEMTFDPPVDSDSKALADSFDEARKIVKEEFAKQYEPYKKLFIDSKKGGE